MYKNILFEIRKECVGILTINRPEVLNALNIETFRELNHLLEILETERKNTGFNYYRGWKILCGRSRFV